MLPDSTLPWPVAPAGVVLIANSESCRLRAYQCAAGVWTIGWGRTEGVVPGMTCTQEQADRWLCEEMTARVAQLRSLLLVHAEPNQLAAMLSLHYNIGHSAFAQSTVLKSHNRGDFPAAARAFALWNQAKVKGKLTVLEGLVIRRAAEAALYLTPEPGQPPLPIAQALQAESSLVRSPLAQGGALTVAVGALGSDTAAQVQFVKETIGQARTLLVEVFHVPPDSIQPVMLVAVGAAICWWRWYQRRKGWA